MLDDVRLLRGFLMAAFKPGTRVGAHEGCGGVERIAGNADIDRGAQKLAESAKDLRLFVTVAVQNDAIRGEQHVLQTGRAADGGALTHGVPILFDFDAAGVAIHISGHEPASLIECENRNERGGQSAGAIILRAVEHKVSVRLPHQAGLEFHRILV